MTKTKKILSVLAPVLAVAATATIVTTTVTSCARVEEPFRWQPEEIRFDANLKSTPVVDATITTPRPSILPATPAEAEAPLTNNIDANFNLTPINTTYEKLKQYGGAKDQHKVEKDVQEIIYNYLATMPKSSSSSLQLADRKQLNGQCPIADVVFDTGLKKDFVRTRKLNLKFKVWVKDESISKFEETNTEKPEETPKGVKLVEDVSMNVYTEFAGKEEILKVINRVVNNKPSKTYATTEENTPEVELSDYDKLLTLLVGKDNLTNPFNFYFEDIEQLKYNPPINEHGLLKYISNYNDIWNSNGRIFGYTFNTDDFWTSLEQKYNNPTQKPFVNNKTIDSNNVYWAPSISYPMIFSPKVIGGEQRTVLNAFAKNARNKFNSFESLKTAFAEFKTEVTDSTKLKKLVEQLAELNITVPYTALKSAQYTETKYSVTKDVKAASVDSLSLKVVDKNDNVMVFDFYSNWWKPQPQPTPPEPTPPETAPTDPKRKI